MHSNWIIFPKTFNHSCSYIQYPLHGSLVVLISDFSAICLLTTKYQLKSLLPVFKVLLLSYFVFLSLPAVDVWKWPHWVDGSPANPLMDISHLLTLTFKLFEIMITVRLVFVFLIYICCLIVANISQKYTKTATDQSSSAMFVFSIVPAKLNARYW